MVFDHVNNNASQTENIENWFNDMVANLRYDQALLENDILEDEKRKVYDAMMKGNQEYLHYLGKQTSHVYFITKMLEAYIKLIIQAQSAPRKLGLELSDSKVLVWAEIVENDELMENALILAEAKINADFSKQGFSISSTIVEDCDNLPIPGHYKSIPIVKKN